MPNRLEESKIILHTHRVSKEHTLLGHGEKGDGKSGSGKVVENIFNISSVHEFADSLHTPDTDGEYGYDWYFITQTPILNGTPDYDAHWAGTRQKVDGESWYVGQGRVALYYVDSYVLESYLTNTSGLSVVDTMKVAPVAINNVEEHKSDFGFNISGAVGGEYSSADGAKGTGSLSWGLNFNKSISIKIKDCTCTSYTGGNDNSSRVKWKYDFKNPSGKHQKIEGVPVLAYCAFTPTNIWVWRIPTKYRNQFKTFESSIQANVASIITRNSGLKPAKIINAKEDNRDKATDQITLPFPPLLCCEKQSAIFEKDGGTIHIPLMTEYKSLKIVILDDNDTPCNWTNVKHLQAHTENSVLEVSVDTLIDITERLDNRSCRIVISGNNEGNKLAYQENPDNLEKIEIVVSQLEKLVEEV